MKRNVLNKELRQTVRRSLGRYIAILAIIALGAGMFVGLRVTKTDMVATAQKFTDDTNMFDLRLLSTYGWGIEDVEKVVGLDGVTGAEGSVSLDVIGSFGGSTEAVYRLHSISERIDRVNLLGGRMPVAPGECLVDGSHTDDSVLGVEFTVSDGNEADTLESMTVTTFTVVGYVSTPLYMDMSRGSTTLGNGDLANYIYIPHDAFQVDYFTEIAVTIEGDYEVYTEEFDRAMERVAEALKPDVTLVAQNRYAQLKADGQIQYDDGLKQYEEGLAEYDAGCREARDKLKEALEALKDGQEQLNAGRAELEGGEEKLLEAQALLDENAVQLEKAKHELANARVQTYRQFADAYASLAAGQKEAKQNLALVQDGLIQIDDGIEQIEAALPEIETGIGQMDLLIAIQQPLVDNAKALLELAQSAPVVDRVWVAQLEASLAQAQSKLKEYTDQRQTLADTQAQLNEQLTQLRAQRQELIQNEKLLLDALEDVEQGVEELGFAKAEAEERFLSAQAEIDSGVLQLNAGQKELDAQKLQFEDARSTFMKSQAELNQGWNEYRKGIRDAETELINGQTELEDAKAQLDDGKQALENMAEPSVYILDRNTNAGYVAVNSNSDIMAGVSRVFPLFFLLVAALVCITTMTRMVDEERTQIGVLKAMGYRNREIVNKYLVYSGSAAVIGCGLGVTVGSAVFPKIFWAAYSIILNLTPDIVLTLDWPLCIAVVAAYTAVSMLVTWYCCRRELREVPAELIRPKAPTAGKKIFLEYLPLWNKIGFLNKVMFRNVFRYKQRLLMMLVGIGGCTALLLTGFGIGDSIKEIVSYQFSEVTVYDLEVYFSEGMELDEQEKFAQELSGEAEDILFYHKRSADMYFGDKSREVSLIVADERIGSFIDLHNGDEQLGMPDVGEAYLSVGAAEAMGIGVGDTVTTLDADMNELTLTISGIYDNHVFTYLILRPENIEKQWGQKPSQQMAFINMKADADPHPIAAKIALMDGVMNVTVCQNVAEQVGSMLDALDMIVVTVVICAGLLAGIVLYNLTNISITERIREIATIKVLGFSSGETAAYVFKENLLLSALGTGVGLVGGVFLLDFVMSQIKIDMVWFQPRLDFMSFVWAVVLTMLSACVVDFLLYFKLEKINMAEALKSVE